MSSSLFSRQGLAATLFAIGLAVLLSLSLGSAAADAAPTFKGNANVVLGAGKTGAFLTKSGVKVNRVGATKVNRKGKRFVVKMPVRKLVSAKRSDVSLKGGFVLRKGKHAVRVRALNVAVLKSGKIGIGGSIQKIKPKKSKASFVNIFNVAGKANVNKQGRKTTLRIKNGKVRFTNAVVKKVRNQLRLNRVPRGQIANLNLNAFRTDSKPVDPCVANPALPECQPDLVDPYLAQCNVAAENEVTGAITPAGPLPEFTNLEGATGPAALAWGFKNSYRNYVSTFAAGSIHALDGATTVGAPPKYDGFEFPADGFRYTDNGTPANLADDKAVLEGTGTVVFCATGHGFRVALSNPTLVIDGANSRIDADVDANLSGNWVKTQRVTVATLGLSGTTSRQYAEGGSTVNWTDVPATLTLEGSQAFCGIGELDKCSHLYPQGTALDPISLSVATDVEVDQYQAQCGLLPTSKVDDARTPAGPLPDMTGALATTAPSNIGWGFKQSFREYVYGSMSGGGKGAQALQALDGAGRSMPPGNPTRGFTFPVSAGQYLANDGVDTTDDQAVINGTGTALLCNSTHGFWISISNPSIVIDGENSRIVADISSNETGVWKTTQKVDFADLDLSGITPIYNKSGSEVTWGEIPATLSATAGPFGNNPAGLALDPVTVSLKTAYDTGAGDAAAWDALATYVEANLPYPNPDPTQGGCEVGVPTQGETPTANNARTIDEHVALGGSTSAWMPSPDAPGAVPAVTGTAVTGGGLDWGFRASLRSSISGSGAFNLVEGAEASTDYYGHGGTLPVFGGYGMNMGAAASYFTWPTAEGTYNANAAGDEDDQLVMRSEGVVAFCQLQTPQRYGITFANPTVVIDGADSKLTYEVMARYRLSWIRATVDFASLDVSQATLASDNAGGTITKTWTFPSAAVTLTDDGSKMSRILNSAYVEGLALDGAVIRASFPE